MADEQEKGLFGGIFDGKFFNVFRGDEGDRKAAERRAARRRAKAQADQAFADSLAADLAGDTNGYVAGRIVQNTQGQAVPQLNVAESPAFRKLRSKVVAMAGKMKEQSEIIAELGEDLEDVEGAAMQTRQHLKKVVDRLKEKNKKSENTQGMISDSLLSAANGIISVINVNDKAPNQFFKVAEATLTSLVAADWAEGQTEKWLRLAALVCNIGAFYDPAIGLTSLFTTDEGAIVPSTSTTPTTADDSTGDSFLDGWLANNGLAA